MSERPSLIASLRRLKALGTRHPAWRETFTVREGPLAIQSGWRVTAIDASGAEFGFGIGAGWPEEARQMAVDLALFSDAPVYVASSWRNASLDNVNARLRRAGVATYDFREQDGFHWQDVFPDWGDDWPHNGEMDAPMVLTGMQAEPAERGFKRDLDALDACGALVLVMPCGNSAHLELGYAAGQGKPTCVLLPDGTVRPDLMWKVADLITADLYEMVAWAVALKAVAA